MFAIVKFGNQQFKVKAGDFIRVPYQKVSQGEEIEVPVLGFGDEDQFLFSQDQLKKSKIKAVLLRQSLTKKVLVFKKKRRKGYRKTRGHRQKMSELKVIELHSPDGKVSKVDFRKASETKASETKASETKASETKISEKKASKKDINHQVKKSNEKKASEVKVSKKEASQSKPSKKKVSHAKIRKQELRKKKSSQSTKNKK